MILSKCCKKLQKYENIKLCTRRINIGHLKLMEKRFNEIGIQMLSKNLYDQLFKKNTEKKSVNLDAINKHLKTHGLHNKSSDVLDVVQLNIPKLQGENIDEHFKNIALQISRPYFDIAEKLSSFDLPELPKTWQFKAGWTKYTSSGWEKVEYPDEDGLVVDVEVSVTHGNIPVIATAVSPTAW